MDTTLPGDARAPIGIAVPHVAAWMKELNMLTPFRPAPDDLNPVALLLPVPPLELPRMRVEAPSFTGLGVRSRMEYRQNVECGRRSNTVAGLHVSSGEVHH